MTPRHHPGDETLLAYAAGSLGAGPALVVSVHLEGCSQCRAQVAVWEVAGGVLMDQLPPATLSSQALARAMAAIERPAPSPAPLPVALRGGRRGASPAFNSSGLGAEFVLPAALQGRRLGRWRWLAPGMRWSRVDMPGEPGANVVLIRGRAAAFLPGHSHRGGEFTQVLAGAINEPGRHYAAGDMFEADDTTNHHLTVAADGVCICLAAFEGRQRMDSLIGRLVQPLLGP